jgi:hypothetical protein
MKKLDKYLWDYGTDSLEALVQLMIAKNNIKDDLSGELTKIVSQLTEGLREYALESGLREKVADYR